MLVSSIDSALGDQRLRLSRRLNLRKNTVNYIDIVIAILGLVLMNPGPHNFRSIHLLIYFRLSVRLGLEPRVILYNLT